MNGPVERNIIGDHFFVNNCFGSFFRGVLDWMGDDFYPRFNYKVIGTYDKAVEFFNKKKQLGKETDSPLLPSVTLDPTYDFSPEERGGRFLWQTMNLSPLQGVKLFEPINLREQNVIVTPIFSRYQGTFELIFWLSSVYELLDFRTLLLQYTGGYNRWIRPKIFWSSIYLPDEIKNFKDEFGNPLDWGNSDATYIHIDNMNQTKFAHPIMLNPMFKLDSLNDNSTKYGGDQIAEYKLSATMTYEIELPTRMVLSNKVGITASINFGMGKVQTKHILNKPSEVLNEISKIEEDFKDIKTFRDYKIVQSDIDKTRKIGNFNSLTTYPTSDIFIDWCPIFKGKVVLINQSNYDQVKFEKGDIAIFERFNQNYMSFIRKSSGIICKIGGSESILYKKSILLNKPMIMNINDNDYNLLLSYSDREITIDTLNKTIYEGLLGIQELDKNDMMYGYNHLKSLRNNNPNLVNLADSKVVNGKFIPEDIFSGTYDQITKSVIYEKCDGITTVYNMPKTPIDSSRTRLYINGDIQHPSKYTIQEDQIEFNVAPKEGSTLSIRDLVFIQEGVRLYAIYEFTQYDIDNFKDGEELKISLPNFDKDKNKLLLVSYSGILDYDSDWLYGDDCIITSIEPKENELIELYTISE